MTKIYLKKEYLETETLGKLGVEFGAHEVKILENMYEIELHNGDRKKVYESQLVFVDDKNSIDKQK